MHKKWIYFSGLIWALAGFSLLYKGLSILGKQVDPNTASWWMAAGLLVGFIKGRFVLAKTVRRMCQRIASLAVPISVKDVYPKSYWILLGSMMLLGFALRLVPLEWRGFIDVAVGSALLHGALLYVKAARSLVVSGS
ncbi:MAG: hypothetical protein KGJ02_07025 [Verrucomicrobiota bacterium]|nr:hypothetical protein [Verrucomicrobiota bacterium]